MDQQSGNHLSTENAGMNSNDEYKIMEKRKTNIYYTHGGEEAKSNSDICGGILISESCGCWNESYNTIDMLSSSAEVLWGSHTNPWGMEFGLRPAQQHTSPKHSNNDKKQGENSFQ